MTSSKPQVSVLIVAYQAEAYLQRALDSVGEQTFSDWEVVVIEDGSRDGTEEIVRRFATQSHQPVRYLNNNENRGVSYSRTRSLKEAKGLHVSFLDADDWWSPEHLADARAILGQGHGLCYSGVNVFDSATQSTIYTAEPSQAELDDPRLALFRNSFIQTSSCVSLSRSCFESVGEFDSNLSIGEDRDYWLRCAEGGFTIAYTGNSTCNYFKHAANTMSKTIKVAEQSIVFQQKRFLDGRYPLALRRSQLIEAYRNHALVVKSQDRLAAIRSIQSAVKLQPSNPGLWLRWLQISLSRKTAT